MNNLSASFCIKTLATIIPATFLLAACGGGGSADDGGVSSGSTVTSASTGGDVSSVSTSASISTSSAPSTDASSTDASAPAVDTSSTSSSSSTSSTPEGASDAAILASTAATGSDTAVGTGTNTGTSASNSMSLEPAAAAGTSSSSTCTASTFGTFDKPYAANSPWNSKPVNPVFGTDAIPTSSYFPLIGTSAYSTQAFKATASDGAVTITGVTAKGVWDPDAEVYHPSVTIPHWPAGVTPATGSDGHAEIVDTSTGIVHSFWQLKTVNGAWQAQQYAWTALNGRGWGDPAHYMSGARSAGVSTLGGLIRAGEINDGASMYKHALAMSLTYNGLSKSPTYVFPATSADWDAATANSGAFPLGSLLMLPSNFDTSTIANLALRKVAETLKNYGAYAVDRNTGTPYAIYVENNSGFTLMPGGWNNQVANDLQRIRAAMRRVVTAGSWVDGNGQSSPSLDANQNILSMRGTWSKGGGPLDGVFDTTKQAVVFPTEKAGNAWEVNATGRSYSGVTWGKPTPGTIYRLTASATGGGSFRMVVKSNAGAVLYDSGIMFDGQATNFAWPTGNFWITTYASNAKSGVPAVVSATLKMAASAAASSATTCAP